MKSYQTLLDEAIRLVNAERGFIVLIDPSSGTAQYVATHNFEPADNQYSDKMFRDLANSQPLLTDNSITLNYRPPGLCYRIARRKGFGNPHGTDRSIP